MLGISRWTDKGGSYRTIQRLFHTVLPWAEMHWAFFRQHALNPEDEYLLAGDEWVVTKSGKKTHGVDRFFSGLYGKPVPGVAFFGLSLISIEERQAYPGMVEQRVRSEAEKTAAKAAKKKSKKKRKRGKPGRPKTQVELPPELQQIQGMVQRQLALIKDTIQVTYLVLDGKFGNNNALQMTRQCDVHLISKLRHDAALYIPYVGPQSKYGQRRKYGDKLNYHAIPSDYLKETTLEDGIQTQTFQATLLHKDFAQPLNVVIIVKTDLKTGKQARVILFSSDLSLSYERLIDYYSLRFQIEFIFRDAKQHFGLEDFMNVAETAVTNAANLSFLMVTLSRILRRLLFPDYPDASILDLKARFRGRKYVAETLKLLPEIPDPILLDRIFYTVASLGAIHTVACHSASS